MKNNFLIISGIFSLFIMCGVIITLTTKKAQIIELPPEISKEILVEPKLDSIFSIDTLANYLVTYKVKHPHVVLAQAIHETGRFSSKIFKENNNLFGLKMAYSRPTTALGTKNGHAYYASFEMSVLDYALFQAAYMRKLKSEDKYLRYLNKNYATDPKYDDRLKDYFKETKAKFNN